MKLLRFFTTPLLTLKDLSWWHALVGFAVSLVCAMIPATILSTITFTGGDENQIKDLSTYLLPLQMLGMFVIGVPVLRLMRGKKYNDSDLGFVHPKPKYAYVLGAAVGVLFIIISQVATWLSPELSDAGKKVIQQVGMGEYFWRDLVVVLSGTIAAPLGEELVYRGLIFRGLHDQMKRAKSRMVVGLAFIVPAIVSAILFATSHGGEGQGTQVVYLTLFGVFAAWLYWKTKSLYVPMVMHSIVNVINFGMMAMTAPKPVSPIVYAVMIAAPLIVFGVAVGAKRLMARR